MSDYDQLFGVAVKEKDGTIYTQHRDLYGKIFLQPIVKIHIILVQVLIKEWRSPAS